MTHIRFILIGIPLGGLLMVIIFICSQKIYASVVLNEVAIQPNQVVELYNTASASADISSWYIDDAGGTTYFTVPQQTTLLPQSCMLFNADFNFNKTSADSIRLFDNTAPPTSTSAKLVEQYSYTKAPDANYSFSKKKDGGMEWQTISSSLGLLNESLQSCIPSPTPTLVPTNIPSPMPLPPTATPLPTQASSPTPIQNIQNIYISEVYPYPLSGEQEWVELYNANDSQIFLDHWYIDDVENGGSAPKSFSLTLDPHSYNTIALTSSMFNNDGDSVRLLDSLKIEKDSTEYGSISQGKSWGRISFSDDTFCEQEPTKNSINSACIKISSPIVSTSLTSSSLMALPKKTPTDKISIPVQQLQKTGIQTTKQSTIPFPSQGAVLAAETSQNNPPSPTPYLSFISFSYSLLTIVSICIKMRYA